jgi:hypothetical protein
MSDLQTRLAKLRASNQAIKAVADRIDSAKVLASGVMDELDDVIEALPVERPPAPLPTLAIAPVELELPDSNEALQESEPVAVFVKDEAPQVAGVLPEIIELTESNQEVADENEVPHEPLSVRREGGG